MANMYPSKKAGGGTPRIQLTELWRNSNTSSSFSAQTITLSQSFKDFDYVLILSKSGTSLNGSGEILISKDDLGASLSDTSGRQVCTITAYVGNSMFYSRTIQNDRDYNGNRLIISSAQRIGASGTNNAYIIPWFIYGGKLTT